MKNDEKLETAKQVIKKHFYEADCGIYDSRNCADYMCTIYDDGELIIDICYYYSYFEVFGLSNEDFAKLSEFYEDLQRVNM